ncbi:MAG: NAD(P)H-hydrate epimerase, partial [Opitutales bacterium]
MITASHPILSCDGARRLEERRFAGDEAKEWPAMQQAGRAVAAAVLEDFAEIGGFPSAGRVLVLAGKGHNGGDALLAAQAVLERFPAAHADVLFVFGERDLRPLAVRAYRALAQAAVNRLRVVQN